MRKLLTAAVLLTVLTAPALAGSCPNLMNKVDEALATASISDEDKSKVLELRQKGEEQHASGQHAESVATLNEALRLLGM